MAQIQRVRVALTGLVGLPGVNTFYANAGADMIAPLRAFYDTLKVVLPVGMQVQVENTGDTIDDVTGTLTGAWIGSAVAPVVGTALGVYAAPAGACVNWLTGTIVGGRRLRGRTFIVPISAGYHGSDGSLAPELMALLTDACATLQVATVATFVVWGRPRDAAPATATRPAVTARVGTSALVTASAFKDKIAVLRSRRD